MDILLCYKPGCPYCDLVIDHMEKLGVAIQMVNINEDPRWRDYLKEKGGKVQVPCLLQDGETLYESKVIMEWITKHKDEL